VAAFQDPSFVLRAALGIMFFLTASAHWGKRRPDLIRMVLPSAFSRPDRYRRSTPTEAQSISKNDFECFASTGVKERVTWKIEVGP